ncbi:Putative Ig domain-containing protein [Actinokineospora alba]|uniref:Putative Ig domain-containing protein n=1 Tax=Actinokineospora alba TaxID=504798 RepID=A0A1H0LR90_9PSEU|nr:Putative Ig domain-containing protein [Actinokineospora alba]
MLGANPRRRAITLVVSTVLVGAAVAIPGHANAASPAEAPIRLVTGEFLPSSLAAVPHGLEARSLGASERGSYLVQFEGPVREDWKAGLTALGATIVEYIPDYAFKVRMNPGQANRAGKLAGVHYVGRFQSAWKVTKDAKAKIDEGKAGIYTVRAEQGVDLAAVRRAAEATGAVVTDQSDGTLLVAAEAGQAGKIAGIEDVASLDQFQLPEKHNEHAAGTVMRATQANARGYDGSTQIVAVADTGLGGGTAATAHPDIPAGRMVAIHDWPGADSLCYNVMPDGPADVDSGHGTHVAVSVVGDGQADGVGKAAAYGARLIFQAVEDYADALCAQSDGYGLHGLPADLARLFQQAYDGGARIHANSWGSAAAGSYTATSQHADRFINTHRDMLITFSAGNSGTDANGDGVIDNDSMGAPATGKNVLTVGASENGKAQSPCDASLVYPAQIDSEQPIIGNRSCRDLNGQNIIPSWGARWPAKYPAEPIASDPQTGNAQQVAAFSSRGPTDDGRIKPDIVAPGSWILSGYSDRYQQGYDGAANPRNNGWQNDGYGFPLNDDYKYFSGTSMSNPLAAGGATVVRDFYNKKHTVNASAALVKGTMVNSATDLLDENGDGANDNDLPVPNAHEGWGLVNLDKATAGTAKFVDEAVAGLATGGVSETKYTVEAGQPLKITMAYSDKEAAINAAVTLVNDLDLEVVSPTGTVYRGNVFAGGWSNSGGTADRRNNLENVYLQNPVAGEWTVRVRGFNVPQGPQKFALVVDGKFGAGGAVNANPVVTNPGNKSTQINTAVNLQIQAADANNDVLTYAASGLPTGLSIGASNGLISGTPTAAGTSNVTVTVTDGKGGSGNTAFTWTVTAATQPNQLLANPGFESGNTGWSGTTAGVIVNSTTRPTHGGSWWALLGGNGNTSSENLYQQVTIPASAASASVSYWVRIDTAETTTSTAFDKLQLQVLNSSGTVLGTLGTLSNLNKSTSYVQKTYDLSAYKGQTIRLRWLVNEDVSLQTTFAVDDTALTVS